MDTEEMLQEYEGDWLINEELHNFTLHKILLGHKKLDIWGDSKLLSGFLWPVIFKPEIAK
jgi:hypothetical protein